MTTRVLIVCAAGIRLPDILPRLTVALSRPGADYEVITICNADKPGHDADWEVEEWARAQGFRATIGFRGVSEAMWHVDGGHCMVFGADARCQKARKQARKGTYSPWRSLYPQRSKGVNLRVLEA